MVERVVDRVVVLLDIADMATTAAPRLSAAVDVRVAGQPGQ